ncbi:MAG TPA: hypothetical protein VFX87_16255 [Methylomirabilota bacterium]|nr:hypothetical protein [Methylomirabilota bacterium]
MIGGTLHLALIYLHPGQQDALRRYENLALPVFRRHGGRFERILSPWRVAGGQPDPDEPDEIHLLRFEAAEGLDAVRRDPEMAALAPIRREIVRKALLLQVEDVPLERYFTPRS